MTAPAGTPRPSRAGKPPYPHVVRANPAFEAWLERRAVELCVDAEEGHTRARPCFPHLHQARVEGLAAWGLGP